MAAELAREIIAQSRGGSKLAFSFNEGEALLYTSKENALCRYHVHKGQSDGTEQYYEFMYSTLEAAAGLAFRMLSRRQSIGVKLVFHKNGIDCEEVVDLGVCREGGDFTSFLKRNVKLIDVEVINVTVM